MSKRELCKRYFLLVVGLFFSGLGIAFTKHGELGVTPISSVANVMSFKFPALSMGTWLFIWNGILILGQIVILRKEFQKIQLLQVPLSVLFGYFTDCGMWLVSFLPVPNYAVRLAMLFVGILILALGISMAVAGNVIMNSGEAIVKAIADKTGFEFGNVKVCFDVSCVLTAVILSLIFFEFKLVGTREGTIISALVTGFVVKQYMRFIRRPLEAFIHR